MQFPSFATNSTEDYNNRNTISDFANIENTPGLRAILSGDKSDRFTGIPQATFYSKWSTSMPLLYW